MADLNQVRIQVLDPETGAVVDNVDVKTSDGAVYLRDGSTLRSWLEQHQDAFSKVQRELAGHLATTHVDPTKVAALFTGMNYDGKTGVFTITKHDGTTQTIDTLLEKVTVNFTMEEGTGADEGKTFLVLTKEDGTKQTLDVTKLINVYTGENGTEVNIGVDNNGKISATVNDASIAEGKLTADVTTKINQIAAADKLGRVIIGDGIDVDGTGKISAANVKSNGVAAAVNFNPVTNTVALAVTGPADAVVFTTVDTVVPPLVVTATKTGGAAAEAALAYQWYKKVIGTDATFSAIEGATGATLDAAKIDVSATGSTTYYCVVSASGEGVVADPVTSSRTTVVVEAAA